MYVAVDVSQYEGSLLRLSFHFFPIFDAKTHKHIELFRILCVVHWYDIFFTYPICYLFSLE